MGVLLTLGGLMPELQYSIPGSARTVRVETEKLIPG